MKYMEKPLYEDEQLKITLAVSPLNHLLWIKEKGEYDTNYLLAKNCLKDFALTQRGKLESKLNNYNPEIWHDLTINNLTIHDVHIALCQAYIEDEERIQRGIKTINKQQ